MKRLKISQAMKRYRKKHGLEAALSFEIGFQGIKRGHYGQFIRKLRQALRNGNKTVKVPVSWLEIKPKT